MWGCTPSPGRLHTSSGIDTTLSQGSTRVYCFFILWCGDVLVLISCHSYSAPHFVLLDLRCFYFPAALLIGRGGIVASLLQYGGAVLLALRGKLGQGRWHLKRQHKPNMLSFYLRMRRTMVPRWYSVIHGLSCASKCPKSQVTQPQRCVKRFVAHTLHSRARLEAIGYAMLSILT